MKFMFVARFKDSFYALSPAKQKQIKDASTQYIEKWAKEGKLKEIYYLGNMKGVMAIFDLNSAEVMARLVENPVFSFMDAEFTPLVDIDVVRKLQAKK